MTPETLLQLSAPFVNILAALWAAYVVARLESLAKHHRNLRDRVIEQHGVEDE